MTSVSSDELKALWIYLGMDKFYDELKDEGATTNGDLMIKIRQANEDQQTKWLQGILYLHPQYEFKKQIASTFMDKVIVQEWAYEFLDEPGLWKVFHIPMTEELCESALRNPHFGWTAFSEMVWKGTTKPEIFNLFLAKLPDERFTHEFAVGLAKADRWNMGYLFDWDLVYMRIRRLLGVDETLPVSWVQRLLEIPPVAES